jgi:hypothetical protein
MASKPRKLPAALARNVAREAELKKERLAREARADIALVKRRRARITEDFYDIGEAIARLRRPGIAQSLGFASFAKLCAAELDMSESQATHLATIVKAIPREDALRLGQERSAALVSVATAMGSTTSPAALATTRLRLPSGRKLDVAKASVDALREAAKEIRAEHAPAGAVRGRTTTTAERVAAARLEAALHAEGVETARVKAVATRPGHAAVLRIEVPVTALGALAKVARRS